MGAPELIIIIYVGLFAFWGYKAGANRNIGSTAGLFLGLFLGFIGIIIVLCSNKIPYNTEYLQAQSIPEQLQKYKELLDSGAITEAEYNIQKGKLLNH